MFIPVILSGGEGTRLWPLSRPTYPKQFLSLCSDSSLFQDTLKRLDGLDEAEPPIILCHEDHRFIVAENIREWGGQVNRILLEPVGRNTAPAIAVACWYALELGYDPVLVVFPADHVMEQGEALNRAIHRAVSSAMDENIVTFGVKPTCPHTGYGYIKTGIDLKDGVKVIDAFTEKPDMDKAELFIGGGDYLWNSGIYCFKASVYLKELKKQMPKIEANSKRSFDLRVDEKDFLRLEGDCFAACEKISIDYAVMERTNKGVVVPLDVAWSDVGTWDALWDIVQKDEHGNALTGEVIAQCSSGNLIRSHHKMVCTIGINDLCIIDTPDTLLVASKSHIHQVNNMVNEIAQAQRDKKSGMSVSMPDCTQKNNDINSRTSLSKQTS